MDRKKRRYVVLVTDVTVETLRAAAASMGLVCKSGTGAPTGRGSLNMLLEHLAQEYQAHSERKA